METTVMKTMRRVTKRETGRKTTTTMLPIPQLKPDPHS